MNDETVQKTMQKIWIGEDAMYEIVRGDAGRVFGWGRRLSFHADDDCYILVPAKDAEIERLRKALGEPVAWAERCQGDGDGPCGMAPLVYTPRRGPDVRCDECGGTVVMVPLYALGETTDE